MPKGVGVFLPAVVIFPWLSIVVMATGLGVIVRGKAIPRVEPFKFDFAETRRREGGSGGKDFSRWRVTPDIIWIDW